MDRDHIISVIKEKPKETIGEYCPSWLNRRKRKPRLWISKETLKVEDKSNKIIGYENNK